MTELFHLSWRLYPAAVLIAAGLLLAGTGLRRCLAAWRRPGGGVMQPLTWMGGFRSSVFGLAVAGAGAAWIWQIGWLLALALVIGFEETLETSIAIGALREEPRLEAEQQRRRPA
jgi:hypothetical protein